MKFVGTKVHHLSSNTSNHIPLWIVPDGLELPYTVKPFWFEEMWLSDLSCPEIAEVVWSSRCTDDPSVEVMKKIFKLGKDLSKWNRDHFGNVWKELEKKKSFLEEKAMRTGINFRIRALKQEINDLIDKENWLWFQWAKVLWATNGDKNSKFFHRRATQQKWKNSILKIWDTSSQ